jgi:hypothetical protein
MTQGERLAGMEVQVRELKEQFTEHQKATDRKFDEVNQKLDDLLALRNKGAGVFWLISTLVGAGIVGGALQILEWFRS